MEGGRRMIYLTLQENLKEAEHLLKKIAELRNELKEAERKFLKITRPKEGGDEI